MDTYVADAHALVWFIAEDGRLSELAGHILEQAEAAVVQVLVPTIVLAELAYIAQKKKVKVTIEEILERIERGDGFAIVPFDYEVFKVALRLPSQLPLLLFTTRLSPNIILSPKTTNKR